MIVIFASVAFDTVASIDWILWRMECAPTRRARD